MATTRLIERGLIAAAAVLWALAAGHAFGETVPEPAAAPSLRALDAEAAEGLLRRSLLKSGLATRRAERIVAALVDARRAVAGPSRARRLRRVGLELRERLGPEDYDWLLFAGGVSNRVVVRAVPEATPAGLQPGDVIIDHDGVRVFRLSDVEHVGSRERRGAPVRVTVERRGRRVALMLARGPLAAELAAEWARP